MRARRRHGLHPAADDSAAVRRQDRGRSARADRGLQGRARLRHRSQVLDRRSGRRRSGEKRWRKALHDGVIEGAKPAEVEAHADAKWIAAALAAALRAQAHRSRLLPSASAWDGRFANNGWLQEAPDPMTKLTWDNAALVSPATAGRWASRTATWSTLDAPDGKSTSPVHGACRARPTIRSRSRSATAAGSAGASGRGVGHDVYPLRTSDAMCIAIRRQRDARPARKHKLVAHAGTPQHGGPPAGARGDARRVPQGARTSPEKPDAGTTALLALQGARVRRATSGAWSIDLNACIGCNACLVACQAENNIPIVGKEQVARGREMHWIRLDRYFAGAAEDPQVVVSADGLPAVRERAVRNGLPGGGDHAQRRRA